MKTNNLLLERSGSDRPERTHDGKVEMVRSNLRWCSDGLEFACWNGDVIRAAFLIDAHDREIIACLNDRRLMAGACAGTALA